MKKLQIVFATILAISMLAAGYAASFVPTHTIPSGVRVLVRYGLGPITAYWDFGRTQRVVSIDFGDVLQGDSKYVNFWVFNENTTYAANVTWSSDIGTVTSGKITDWFSPDIQYMDLGAGVSQYTAYGITVAADTPVQVYNWTLTLGAQV
jgi:hypothetical protein